MSRRITQTDLDAEIRSYLAGVRTPEPASLGQVLHRLPERTAASRRWSLAISALVGSAALAVVLIAAVVIIGLPLLGSRSGPAAPAATSGPTVAAATPGPPASAAAADLRTFNEDGLTFAYPTAWREFHYSVTSSFSSQIAYLATVDVQEPCTTTADASFTTTQCANRYQLTPGTLVVGILGGGSPGFDMTAGRPAGSTALTVGGLPAYLETVSPPAADLDLRWTISRPGMVDNFYTIDAQMRGPGIEAMRAQLEALIASVRYDPPVVPLPTGSAAALAAAQSALAALVKDSPVWGCFSLSGPQTVRIDSMPDGPPLAHPQLATCTMKIEASPLQLWRMSLSMRLSTPDPNVGTGETTIQWINPDGSLGARIGGPLAP
jgi:hypothetical protein